MVGLKAPVTSLWETQWEGQVCSLLCGGKCPTWWEKQDSVGPVAGNVQHGGGKSGTDPSVALNKHPISPPARWLLIVHAASLHNPSGLVVPL